jgi:hypothetical protein
MAAAILLKAGAAAAANYPGGTASFLHARGGTMIGAAIGSQRFFYGPAFIGHIATSAVRAGKRVPSKRKPATGGRARKRA